MARPAKLKIPVHPGAWEFAQDDTHARDFFNPGSRHFTRNFRFQLYLYAKTICLRQAGERIYSALGFAAIIISTALFVLYITNDTVVIEALRQRAGSGKMPEWWPPLRSHFRIVGDVKVALTYLAIAAFAAALPSVGWLGRIASWVLEGLSLIAVPLVALLPLYPAN